MRSAVMPVALSGNACVPAVVSVARQSARPSITCSTWV